MYFKPDNIQKMIEGQKTVTRRVCKPNEEAFWDGSVTEIVSVCSRYLQKLKTQDTPVEAYRLKWRVGNDYAVSPGRGKPGVWWCSGLKRWSLPEHYIETDPGWKPLRIRLLSIRREPLQAITLEDVIAEGVKPYTLAKGVLSTTPPDPRWKFISQWGTINGVGSWGANPDVFALEFCVVK